MPPPAFARIPHATRFITGCALGTVTFILIFLRLMDAPGFYEYIANMLNNLIQQNALFMVVNTEMVFEAIRSVLLRGGSLIAAVLMFALSRQTSLLFARLIPGKTRNTSETFTVYLQRVNTLEAFRAPPLLIWIFSSSLLLVVLTSRAGFQAPEIVLWNILILSAILYLAQGVGILQTFLSRPALSPFIKLLCLVLIIFMFFSPVLNMALLAGFVLLGIAENWVPFRVSKKDSPPSTPEG